MRFSNKIFQMDIYLLLFLRVELNNDQKEEHKEITNS